MNTILDVTEYKQKGVKMEDPHKRKLLRQKAFPFSEFLGKIVKAITFKRYKKRPEIRSSQ